MNMFNFEHAATNWLATSTSWDSAVRDFLQDRLGGNKAFR
jgi:hypothetical protein